MVKQTDKLLTGIIISDEQQISMAELCQYCTLPAECIITMIEYGIIEPVESRTTVSHWQFSAESVLRVKTVTRLQRDLGVNLAGAALALDLLDEVKVLRKKVAALKSGH